MKLVEILTTLFLSLALVSSSELNQDEVTVSNDSAQTGYSPLPASELLSLLKDAVSKDYSNQVRTLLEDHVPISQSSDEETSQQTINHPGTGTNILSQDEFDINSIISDQGTLLHWAADRGHSDLVPVLLVRGAEIDSKYEQLAMTPLMLAARYGHGTVAAQLLNALATHPERMHSLITTQNKHGMTALHLAAWNGHAAVVAQLLYALATQPEHMHSFITTQDNDGQTALHYAALSGREAVVALLLNAPATHPELVHSLIITRNNDGWTALHYAAYNGHEAVVALLLNTLATHPERMHSFITTQDSTGMTALHYATQGGHKAIATLLSNALATHLERV